MSLLSCAALLAVTLLAGAELVFGERIPGGLPPLWSLALRMAALTVMARAADPLHRNLRLEVELGFWAALLWVPLPLLVGLAGGRVAGVAELLALALVPVGALFAQTQSGHAFGPDRGSFSGLLTALLGFGGVALLLPYTLPASTPGRAWLASMAVAAILAGVALFRMQTTIRGVALRPGVAAASSGIAFASVILARFGPPLFSVTPQMLLGEAARLFLLDAPLLILTLFLLRRVGAPTYATRYLLVPLLVAAAALAVERPKLTWTMAAGAALILGASSQLLREPESALAAVPQEPR